LRPRLHFNLCVVLLALLAGAFATPSHAFAPQAAVAVASLAPRALPPAARWETQWSAAAAAEVELRLTAEESDPESSAALHRFLPHDTEVHGPSTPDEVSGRAFVIGKAPAELAAAAAELRQAFTDRSPHRIVRAVARVAIGATDLADPYLTSPHGGEEAPGAHAHFSDLIGPEEVAGLPITTVDLPGDIAAAGRLLAAQSAVRRDDIDAAMRLGDHDGVAAARRERLGAALALARRILLSEWRAAGEPLLEDPMLGGGVTHAIPNPTRGPAKLWFSLPRSGHARVELFDVTGRRVLASDLGRRPPGPQEFTLAPAVMNALHPGVYFTRVTIERVPEHPLQLLGDRYRTVGRLVIVRD
jgi:hypothetical protein